MKVFRLKNCLLCGAFFNKKSTESVKAWTERHKFCSRSCLMSFRQATDESVQKNRFYRGCKAINPIKKGQRLSPKTEFKKGHIPWITGKEHPNIWNKRKPVAQISGENHWNWKGGVTSFKKKVRNSVQYKMWKDSVIQRDGTMCVLCGSTDNICVDHIRPFSEIIHVNGITSYEEAIICTDLFDINNGRVLCDECHRDTETYFSKQHITLSNNGMYKNGKGRKGKGGKGKKGC